MRYVLILTTFACLLWLPNANALIWQPPSPLVLSANTKNNKQAPAKSTQPLFRGKAPSRSPAPAQQAPAVVVPPTPKPTPVIDTTTPVSLTGESPLTPKPVVVATPPPVKRTKNVRLDPAGFLLGGANATFEFAFLNRFAVGPLLGLAYYSTAEYSITGYSLGLRGTIGFGEHVLKNGLYFSPVFAYTILSASNSDDSESANFNVYSAGATFGHQWFFQSGFNIGLGGGPRYYFGGDSNYTAYTGIGLMLEILLGWAF